MEHNVELREFLRIRRAAITPERAGITPHPGPRRVRGLRREELAYLAGVSADYYARLEQGRSLNVSESVLDALARALRLNPAERAHLFDLARPPRARTRRRAPAAQRVRPGLASLLAALGHLPVFVLGHRLDVLASNGPAHALLTDFEALPARERNFGRFIFLDPVARERFEEWPEMAVDTVASLRRYSARFPHDPRLAELIGELSLHDADFRRLWADYHVHFDTHRTKHVHHPDVGEMVLDCETLAFPDDPDQLLNVFAAEPGSPSEESLRLLSGRPAHAHAPRTGTAPRTEEPAGPAGRAARAGRAPQA